MSFGKLLIANRGEIACRVIRTAHRLGYDTVAVFSDADAHAPHVAQAREAVRIGPPAAASSYLDVAALLDAARRTGADAIHPGYGFLSENAAFAQACLEAGLVFVGPPPGAIRAMGDKAAAKRRMLEAGVPCLPGYLGDEQSDARLAAEARQLGVPLLVKAVAGGGGRGMRLVRHESELAEALAGARREATSAFGDGTLMLERLIERGRHIEIQVFADAHGHAIHLGERDCTTQRRRQKVIEEAPSPAIDAARRASMGADAVAAARAVGYVGAGTVEFIVDDAGRHHFLEMNTRLQVEHPVTEAITGLDLVEWQLRVAAGEPLPLTQEQVRFSGHAIEVRLCAEDPHAGFAPQTGTVRRWRPPPHVRVDHGLADGLAITPWYDAMVGKVIAHGATRDDAIRRLRAALAQTALFGVRHNAGFLHALLGHEDFRRATLVTATLDDWSAGGHALLQRPAPADIDWAVAALALAFGDGVPARADSVAAYDLKLACDDTVRAMRVHTARDGALHVAHGDATIALRLIGHGDGTLRYQHDGVQRSAIAWRDGDALHLLGTGGATFVFTEPSAAPRAADAADPSRLTAPVAGVVARVAVGEGDVVSRGQPLVCVEAMKMELWVAAAADGRVAALRCRAGETVASGAVLVELDLQPAAAP